MRDCCINKRLCSGKSIHKPYPQDPTGAQSMPQHPIPHTIDAGGLALRLWEHPAAVNPAPVVLLVHGYLDTGRSYDTVVDELAGKAHVFCLDWRGHGESAWASGGGSYHLLDHMKDLVWTLKALEKKGTPIDALVAHSMGGNIAIMVAGSWPQLVPRLLMLDAFGPPSESPEAQPERLQRVLQQMLRTKTFRSFDSREAAIDRLRLANPYLSHQGAQRMVQHALKTHPEDPSQLHFGFDPRLRGPTPVRYPEQTWLTFCKRIQGPVRVLRAERGYVPQGELLDQRLAACNDVALTNLPGTSHHLHVECPDIVAQSILDLLTCSPNQDTGTKEASS